MGDLHRGDIVVFRDRISYSIVRIDIVREKHVTGFGWDHTARQWQRARRRVMRNTIASTLGAESEVLPAAEKFKILANIRDAERRRVMRDFDRRVEAFLAVEAS
jgi:hypothetical protein